MSEEGSIVFSIPFRKYWTYVPALAYLQKQCKLFSRKFEDEFDLYASTLPEKLAEELLSKKDGIIRWVRLMQKINQTIDDWNFSKVSADGGVTFMNVPPGLSGIERADYMKNEVRKCREYFKYVVEYVDNKF